MYFLANFLFKFIYYLIIFTLKDKRRHVGVRLKMNNIGWAVVVCLFTDDAVLFALTKREH